MRNAPKLIAIFCVFLFACCAVNEKESADDDYIIMNYRKNTNCSLGNVYIYIGDDGIYKCTGNTSEKKYSFSYSSVSFSDSFEKFFFISCVEKVDNTTKRVMLYSFDGGDSWTKKDVPLLDSTRNVFVCMTHDGYDILFLMYTDKYHLYVSKDYGGTWSIASGLYYIYNMLNTGSVCFDGQNMAIAFNSSIRFSSDFGKTLTSSTLTNCRNVYLSGATIVAVCYGTNAKTSDCYISTNKGVSFEKIHTTAEAYSIHSVHCLNNKIFRVEAFYNENPSGYLWRVVEYDIQADTETILYTSKYTISTGYCHIFYNGMYLWVFDVKADVISFYEISEKGHSDMIYFYNSGGQLQSLQKQNKNFYPMLSYQSEKGVDSFFLVGLQYAKKSSLFFLPREITNYAKNANGGFIRALAIMKS